jgi:hypothetical protein
MIEVITGSDITRRWWLRDPSRSRLQKQRESAMNKAIPSIGPPCKKCHSTCSLLLNERFDLSVHS